MRQTHFLVKITPTLNKNYKIVVIFLQIVQACYNSFVKLTQNLIQHNHIVKKIRQINEIYRAIYLISFTARIGAKI